MADGGCLDGWPNVVAVVCDVAVVGHHAWCLCRPLLLVWTGDMVSHGVD